MKKYPSIEQFRHVVKAVRMRHDHKGKDENEDAIYEHTSDYPVLTFKGTVKLHGTNAAIVRYKDGTTKYQSRERELELTKDNAGFMLAMSNKNLEFLFKDIEFNDYIAVYGEWCGGNIQNGVALTGLPKMFVIFGLMVDDEWLNIHTSDTEQDIYNVLVHFPTYNVDIDFNNPELIQNKLIELTIAVEDECPVGKYFGVSGVGEGIVFTSINYPSLKFKSKGEKHSVSKVKTLNAVDVESLESIKDFVESVVTENRLEQGIQKLAEMGLDPEPKNTGEFLRWVVTDVLKEETDTIVASQLDVKKVSAAIGVKARVFFLNYKVK